MRIEVYNHTYKKQWDDFVKKSKNGTFLFFRDFIEYHGEKFKDYSLMFFIEDELVALMPGHIENKVFYTHKGLTYGGLVMSITITAEVVLKIFEYLIFTFKQQGIEKIIYKAVPHIYHSYPAEEDLYALFRFGAAVTERNISSAILLPKSIEYSRTRKSGIKKSISENVSVEYSSNFEDFWKILETNLQTKYNSTPVHTKEEIVYLKDKFPQNIHLYVAKDNDGLVQGGCLLFETDKLVHVQYSSATAKGKSIGVMDCLIDFVINIYTQKGKTYFDYGTSNENNGLYLNEKLIYQKEGFGARGIIYDIYVVKI